MSTTGRSSCNCFSKGTTVAGVRGVAIVKSIPFCSKRLIFSTEWEVTIELLLSRVPSKSEI